MELIGYIRVSLMCPKVKIPFVLDVTVEVPAVTVPT